MDYKTRYVQESLKRAGIHARVVPPDPPNAVGVGLLYNNLTGEYVDLYLTKQESFIYANRVPQDPIEYGPLGSQKNALTKHVQRLPVQVEIRGMLSHGVKGAPTPPNDMGYPVEKAEKLRRWTVGEKTREPCTLTYYSSWGWIIKDLVIREFNPRNDESAANLIPFSLVLQTVDLYRQSWGEYFRSKVDAGLRAVTNPQNWAIAAAAGWAAYSLGLVGLAGAVGVGLATLAVIGFLNAVTGSIPHQTFSHEILGRVYDFELYWNYAAETAVISVAQDGAPIVTEVPIRYGEDILREVQYDPRVRGLHLVPLSEYQGGGGRREVPITPETLFRTVQILILQELDQEGLAALQAEAAVSGVEFQTVALGTQGVLEPSLT